MAQSLSQLNISISEMEDVMAQSLSQLNISISEMGTNSITSLRKMARYVQFSQQDIQISFC
jgi:hypothetical protein